MAKKNQKNRKQRNKKSAELPIINPNAAGIDIGSFEHWVSVPPDRDSFHIRRFGAFTTDLYEIADWLEACGVDTVAMESTGIYWIPLFQILQDRGFEVYLVNSHYTKNVSGRKKDDDDSDWIRQLHTFGLLPASFQPDSKIRELRSYLRHRDMLISYSGSHIQHMQKALNQMNLHLHHVISDITGVTGMKIIRSILDGQRDPKVLASFRDHRIKASEETIAKALEGNYLEEHLFALQQNLQLYDFYQQKLNNCDQQIEQVLQSFPTLDDIERLIPVHLKQRRRKKKGANAPKFDTESYINQITGCNLFDVPGFGENNLLLLISETGIDMDKWKTEKHFTSWLRLAPNNKISGGKILSRQTQKTKNRANKQFRLAAQSLSNSQCALGAFYRRLRYRVGPAKANVALARKLAIIYYRMLKFKMSYQEMSAEKYDAVFHARQVKNLKKRAKELGFELVQA